MTSQLMRGVFERPKGSGVYWINYYDADGVRHRERIGRQSVAEEAYLQRRIEVREGKFRPPRAKSITFRELAELALADKKLRGRSPATIASDRRRLPNLNARIGNLPAERVAPARIEALLAELVAEGRCGSTANRYRSLASSVFSFGVRTAKVRANPVARVLRFRESPNRIRFLDTSEENALRKEIRKISPQYEAEFDLALNTGIRRGEQFQLKWKDVNLERGVLTVWGKTGRRHVPINGGARQALEKLWPLSNGSAFVCAEAKRDGQSDWRRWFEEARAAAGVDDFRWHDIRHTVASRLVMAGVDLTTVQKILGHKSIVTTQKYAHLSAQHERNAIGKLQLVRHSDGTSAKAEVRARGASAGK